MILALSGTGVSDGIAVGRIHMLSRGELDLPEYHVQGEEIDAQVARLEAAGRASERALEAMEREFSETGGPAVDLLQMHRMMLRDDALIGQAIARIRADGINAEWALDRQAVAMRRRFDDIEDEYLALRREDLDQVVGLLQRELAEAGSGLLADRTPASLEDTVVLAESLSPADLAVLHQRGVAGLVTEHGGSWSHSAILARAYGIPMVMAVRRALRVLREGERVILDSHYGAVLATEDEGLTSHYAEKLQLMLRKRERQSRYLSEPDRTRDGLRFRLFGNAERVAELERCCTAGVVGIGLMRTEFLFSGPGLPGEDEQYAVFREALEVLDGRPLTIRTLDAGGDKLPDSLSRFGGPNPALGLRGVRMSLALPDLFETQLRAILRASAHGPVRLLLPMLTRLDELSTALERIAEVRQRLERDGVPVDPDLQIGGMIETPAAALQAERFAAALDFLSIGTNDLIQYVLAVDRQDELVSHLFDPGSRAVIELIRGVVRAGAIHQRPVQVCGEMSGDPRYVSLLFGLGVREFSMPVGRLAGAKETLTGLDGSACEASVEQFLETDRGDSVEPLIAALQQAR